MKTFYDELYAKLPDTIGRPVRVANPDPLHNNTKISDNGTYDVSSFAVAKIDVEGGGGGSSVDVESLSVTENGTYEEEGKAYSPVTVNVSGGVEFASVTCQLTLSENAIQAGATSGEAFLKGFFMVNGAIRYGNAIRVDTDNPVTILLPKNILNIDLLMSPLDGEVHTIPSLASAWVEISDSDCMEHGAVVRDGTITFELDGEQ